MKRSVCRGGQRIFPTVQDVLGQFNSKMDATAFSQEVKGNYVGALSTRMESLCNGLYGEIFGGKNLSDQELFGTNVIVDLSRVGSAETKSMLMGMLIIRLQEYRHERRGHESASPAHHCAGGGPTTCCAGPPPPRARRVPTCWASRWR